MINVIIILTTRNPKVPPDPPTTDTSPKFRTFGALKIPNWSCSGWKNLQFLQIFSVTKIFIPKIFGRYVRWFASQIATKIFLRIFFSQNWSTEVWPKILLKIFCPKIFRACQKSRKPRTKRSKTPKVSYWMVLDRITGGEPDDPVPFSNIQFI